MKHADLARVSRTIFVAHGEAFQLMLYASDNGHKLWVWNSRDGVTPFGFALDGIEYWHAMRSYQPQYSAVLPDAAQHVWVDYDQAAWERMERERYEHFASLPDSDPYGGAAFRAQWPAASDWLAITPFEPGQPRRMSRDEWLAWTPSYAARSLLTPDPEQSPSSEVQS